MCQNGVYENEKGWELLFTGVPTLVYINENKYINARITPGVMCVCVCVCVCLHKSHTYPNLQDTFLNTGICTMQRTTECCLNTLPYFPKLIVNRNTLSFIKIRRKGSGF